MITPRDFSNNTKTYYKRNYVDGIEIFVPTLYKEDERSTDGTYLDPVDLLIKSHINLAKVFKTVFPVSSTTTTSSLSAVSGASFYFIKQNKVANISPLDFESKILFKYGKSLKDFATSSLFKTYLDETFLPSIRLNTPSSVASIGTSLQVHNYLVQNIDWLYFLNMPVPGTFTYQPSAYISNLLIEKIYNGDNITLIDAMKGVNTFMWHNYNLSSVFSSNGLIPSDYIEGSSTYTSGTQQLDKLLTLTEIVYSDLLSDSNDFRVRDAFEEYIQLQEYPNKLVRKGPLAKFLRAISYGIYDVNDQINNLNYIYDIDKCPEEYLPFVADLIGWKFLGFDKSRWRLQLRNAVSIYKAKGTKKALQIVLNSVFGDGVYDLSSTIKEQNESYLPLLLYYALVTESNLFNDFTTWTREKANSLGISEYSDIDMDTNIRYVVDSIIRDAAYLFPDLFFIGNQPFRLDSPEFVFEYRDRVINIPPFELEKYYRQCNVTIELTNYLYDRITCLGVSPDFAESWQNYINENTVNSENHRNKWLFFTEEKNYPPNYSDIIVDLQKKKGKYLTIWNPKSSHFNVDLDGSSFSYQKYSDNYNSYNGLKVIGKIINEYSPAHAIPNINLNLEDQDIAGYNDRACIKAQLIVEDLHSGSAMKNYTRFAVNMSAGNKIFSRSDVDNISDSLMFGATSATNLGRNSLRNRNLHNILPKHGYYDRTGFNMPQYRQTQGTINSDKYLPLGYIPSANKFQPITYYSSIPDVYSKCEDYTSTSIFYGVATSTTFPCRGYVQLVDNDILDSPRRIVGGNVSVGAVG